MFDRMLPARPRVALVFGDAGSAGHLREAVASQVEIVYETSAKEFDASRLAGSQATAALVNLDDCDWLDPIEASLNDAGIAVVFNDPEISRSLEGWAQARWLRHLTAKLSGKTDYDPPRPAAEAALQPASGVEDEVGHAPVALPAVNEPAMAERPLSPAEIESMTADFVAVQEPTMAAAIHDGDATVAAAPSPENAVAEMAAGEVPPATAKAQGWDPAPEVEFSTSTLHEIDASDEASQVPTPAGTDPEDAAALDVDTEALSAMIDARLAESGEKPSPESRQVWRVVEGGATSAVDIASMDTATGAAVDPDSLHASADSPPPPTAPVDDSDVLSALPSLDDWQLVDPEAPVARAAGPKQEKRAEPAISLDFADLELVPIETVVPVDLHVEPIERWMHVTDRDKAGADKTRQAATTESGGGHA